MPRTSSPASRHMAQLRDAAKERATALKEVEAKYAEETKDIRKTHDDVVEPADRKKREAIAAAEAEYEATTQEAKMVYTEASVEYETARQARVQEVEDAHRKAVAASYEQYMQTAK